MEFCLGILLEAFQEGYFRHSPLKGDLQESREVLSLVEVEEPAGGRVLCSGCCLCDPVLKSSPG